jgi:hypothetical protein
MYDCMAIKHNPIPHATDAKIIFLHQSVLSIDDTANFLRSQMRPHLPPIHLESFLLDPPILRLPLILFFRFHAHSLTDEC